MHTTIEKSLNLIDQNRIDEAFDEIESLRVPYQPLAQLRQEFEGGYLGGNYVQRLKMAVKTLGKRLSENHPPTPASSEAYNTLITQLLELLRSFPNDDFIPPLTNLVKELRSIRSKAYITQLTQYLQELRSIQNAESANLAIPVPPVLRGYEKIIGGRNTLTNINWLVKGLRASKSVCRVVLESRGMGTGFVLEGGYLLTNYHVIEGEDKVSKAKIEFNFEEDAEGKAQSVTTYFLDPADCKFSNPDVLDYAYVKIKDDPQNPLAQWGTLTIEDSNEPQIGQPTIIIQHPEGDIKQIAFEDNDIISVWKERHYLFYKTTTLKGSSGSPVLNRDWKVIALHHAGLDEKQGGMKVNIKEERIPANRGVLMKAIMEDIEKKHKGQV